MAPLVDSCQDCLAWGVTRHEKWLCQACRGWRRRYADTTSVCPACHRVVVLNQRGFCRLCCRQATKLNHDEPTHLTLDMLRLNRDGQQLFFADSILKKRAKQPAPAPTPARRLRWPNRFPVAYRQLVLFDSPRDAGPDLLARLPDPPIPELAAVLAQAVDDHGDEHGWSDWQRARVRVGLRVLLAFQDTPGAQISATRAAVLIDVEGTTLLPVLEVLTSVGMLDDDRAPPLELWFNRRVVGVADPMGSEVAEWFHAIRDGSDKAPRTRPRSLATVERHVWIVMPLLHAWTAEGHHSLREITRDHIVNALSTNERPAHTLSTLRSLFRFLKGRKITFMNPTARLRSEPIQVNPPLPIELGPVRDALNSTDSARAALAALVAFHALRNIDLRGLTLVDLCDGTLHVAENDIVLAEPVRQRVAAWLAERNRRWPNTVNPHLFITSRTAPRTTPVSDFWIIDTIGMSPFKIRQDRILNEAVATGGDVKRLCDLFGITVGTAERYAAVLDHPDLTELAP